MLIEVVKNIDGEKYCDSAINVIFYLLKAILLKIGRNHEKK